MPSKKFKTGASLNKAAAILGSRGGKKGGPSRAKALSSDRKSAIARQGAIARNAMYGSKDIAINKNRGKTNSMSQSKKR